jgi:hypothetical protein
LSWSYAEYDDEYEHDDECERLSIVALVLQPRELRYKLTPLLKGGGDAEAGGLSGGGSF